jgi:hypothetical protein
MALVGAPSFSLLLVFSLMTSFTKCPGTSFTLPRERSERGSVSKNALEDHGSPRTACAVRDRDESSGKVIQRFMAGGADKRMPPISSRQLYSTSVFHRPEVKSRYESGPVARVHVPLSDVNPGLAPALPSGLFNSKFQITNHLAPHLLRVPLRENFPNASVRFRFHSTSLFPHTGSIKAGEEANSSSPAFCSLTTNDATSAYDCGPVRMTQWPDRPIC